MRDIDTDELILYGDFGIAVPDVDGDGLPDIHGDEFVHLQRGATWQATPYPPFQSEWNYYRSFAVGDLTGDGRGDLLIVDDTDWIPQQGFALFQGGYLELYEGTADGYASTPTWTLSVDSPIADAFAIQLDSDPELELYLVGADDWYDVASAPLAAAILTVDLSSGAPVAARPYELQSNQAGLGIPPFAQPLGDVDGDGLDEIVLFLSVNPSDPSTEPWPIAHCLTSSSGWDPERPLWQLTTPAGVVADSKLGLVADVDGDGHREVVTVYRTILGNPDETVIQVWYPFEPVEPMETGATGHTGTASFTDTGSDTGHLATGDTAPTSSSPPGSPASPVEPRGCGCVAASPSASPFSPFTRRRHGGS